jgi:hypothetical protein
MSKFKVGDNVKIQTTSVYYKGCSPSNPKDTGGEVYRIRSCDLGVDVRWDRVNANSYNDKDLVLVTKKDKIDMSKLEELEETIKKAQQQIEELKNPKPKQWEPRGGKYHINGDTSVFYAATSHDNYAAVGATRQTKDAVDTACETVRTHNRLLAYVDEFGGGWVADWNDNCQQKYSLRYDNLTSEWGYSCSNSLCLVGTVYMSKDCVEGVIAKLTSGEVVL